jgi:outer membrane lipoprotein
MKFLLVLTATILLLSACAHQPFSPEARKMADRRVTYVMIKQDPGLYAGKHVMLGGAIASVRNSDEGGELEVTEFRVSDNGRPEESAGSGGRFLARSARFLDPLVYKEGLMVSVVGEVAGAETKPLGGREYAYPVITAKELYVWKPEELYPSYPLFHFGFGVFHGF